MNEQYSAMRSNVSMLGTLLGDTIKDALGEDILDRVESIRKLSKSSRAGNEANHGLYCQRCKTCLMNSFYPLPRHSTSSLTLPTPQSSTIRFLPTVKPQITQKRLLRCFAA